jgi:NAD(P)-dependent dehydrogenase (short-subunit alcohol dehydrogenase family)
MVAKTILITGGAQGIGKITALALFGEGYRVAVIDNDEEALKEFKSAMPEIITIYADICNENQVMKAIGSLGESLMGVVNNAAISANKPISELCFEEWNHVLSVNLSAVFLTSKYALSALKANKGSIVNIASTRAIMSEPHTEAYSASKGGIVSLTHSLAISLGPEIRVNAISPGWIETSHLKKETSKMEVLHTYEDKMQHPVGRVGIAEDIAEMVCYLISDKAGFITGQNFVIDGGMTKKMIYV